MDFKPSPSDDAEQRELDLGHAGTIERRGRTQRQGASERGEGVERTAHGHEGLPLEQQAARHREQQQQAMAKLGFLCDPEKLGITRDFSRLK